MLMFVSDSQGLGEGHQTPQTSLTTATVFSDVHVPLQSEHSNKAFTRDTTVEHLTLPEENLSADTAPSGCQPQRRRKFSKNN